jgi:electron transfer flavoprotein beta subunit
MKIAVCVKQVPEGNSRIDPGTKRLDRSGEGALNGFDANAVEEALRLRDATGEGEVVLVSLGPAGSDLVATSYALAKALEREGADLILFGQQAADSDGAVLWAAVADRLRLPVVSQASEVTQADGTLTVKRQTEFGYDVIETPLPAVVAVSDAVNEPRYPSLKGIMGAKSKPQETVSLSDLSVESDRAGEQGSRTEVYALNDPPPRGDSRKIEDDGNAAQTILDFLVEKRLL